MHGIQTTDPVQVFTVFLEYYKWLLGTSDRGRTPVKQAIINQGPLVTDAMRNFLSSPFTGKEIKDAMWDIDGGKAPGLDGFGSAFYKGAWEDIGDEVSTAVRTSYVLENF